MNPRLHKWPRSLYVYSMKSRRKGPLTNSTRKFATFELGRLGYDLKTGKEVSASNEDADDLLLLLGDRLDPEVFAGVV
jgi:hypothetical protein